MRIYKAAKSRIRKKQFKPQRVQKYQGGAHAMSEDDTLQLSVSTQTPATDSTTAGGDADARHNGAPCSSPTAKHARHSHKTAPKLSKAERNKEKLADKRERKAARTLAIITGSFITCWLPFFAIAIVRPFCGESCRYPDLLISVTLWLGYFNSLLNPIIYTIFSPDFRMAFRKILFGKYNHRRRRRRRTERLGAAAVTPTRKST